MSSCVFNDHADSSRLRYDKMQINPLILSTLCTYLYEKDQEHIRDHPICNFI